MRPSPPLYLRIVVALILSTLYIPIFMTVVSSFQSATGWSLDAFRAVLNRPDILDSLSLSLRLATASSLGATILGTVAAFAIERHQFRGRSIFAALTVLPLSLPEVVTGISLLIWFVFLKWSLGFWSMTCAHITFCFSYVVLVVRARLHGFDRSVEEAAQDLGANTLQVFKTVTFPLILPALVSGFLLSFTLSFDDFLITLFASGAGFDTLPVKVYSMIRYGVPQEINALSTLIFLTTLFIVLIVFRPFRLKPKTN